MPPDVPDDELSLPDEADADVDGVAPLEDEVLVVPVVDVVAVVLPLLAG